MQYTNYEADIVIKYGIELVGWTHDKFCNPSELSNSLEPLRTLLDALNNQMCKFVKLSPQDRRTREAKYQADVASGIIPGKQRKTRKDSGTTRKRKASGIMETDRAGKRIRSAETVHDSDEEAPASINTSTPSSDAVAIQ